MNLQSPHITTAAHEQEWNAIQMAEVVTVPCFRVWTYAAPAIVLGCSQRSHQAAVAERMPPGMELLVRPSGGGAVLTGPWMVSASVVLPLNHPWLKGRFADSYQGLGKVHVDVLAQLGIATRALPVDEVAVANERIGATVDWACYGSLAPWEVVDASGRKLVGLAQRRQRSGVLLVAGTLVTLPEWPLLCTALNQPGDVDAMLRRTVSCNHLSPQPPQAQEFASSLTTALAAALGVSSA